MNTPHFDFGRHLHFQASSLAYITFWVDYRRSITYGHAYQSSLTCPLPASSVGEKLIPELFEVTVFFIHPISLDKVSPV